MAYMKTDAGEDVISEVKFNPAGKDFREDPYPTYREMRHNAPALRTLGTVILSCYDDVQTALKDRDLSVAAISEMIASVAARLSVTGMEQVDAFVRTSVVFTDDAQHARLRRLIGHAYSPVQLAGISAAAGKEMTSLLDQGYVNHSIEIGVVARQLPVNVLCSMMGVAEADRIAIAQRANVLRGLLDPALLLRRHQFTEIIAALAELTDYFIGHAASGDVNGKNTLTAALTAARIGEDKLDATEIAFTCIMTLLAGIETTQYLLANTLYVLHQFPAQLARLRADITLAPMAIDEAMRIETPVHFTKRIARRATNINGHPVREGEPILLCLASANRDERRFSHPDTFDMHRTDAGHLGFGYGMHGCLGGTLAQLQTQACARAFLQRFAHSALDQARPRWQSHSVLLRGVEHLRLAVHEHPTHADDCPANSEHGVVAPRPGEIEQCPFLQGDASARNVTSTVAADLPPAVPGKV